MEIFFLVCKICEDKAQLITHRGKRSEGWLSDLPKDLKVGDVFVGRLKGNGRIAERSTLPKFIAKAYDFQTKRYVDKSDFDYVIPPSIAANPIVKESFTTLMRLIDFYYENE